MTTTSDELWRSTAAEIAGLVRAREVTASEVTEAVLSRMDELEPEIKAFMTTTPEAARAKAADVDEAIAGGQNSGPIAGVPVAIKDIICTRGVRSTASSKILDNYVPPYSATVVERLDAGGCPMQGKTNLDEFAMGSSTENSAYGPSRNPWD
ncbi:MAG: amidase, partial [Actinomycetota bacterium]